MKGCVLLLLWGFPANASPAPAGCGQSEHWLQADGHVRQVPLAVRLENGS